MSRTWKFSLAGMALVALALSGLAYRSRYKTKVIAVQVENERLEIDRVAQRVDVLARRDAEQSDEAEDAGAAVDSSVFGVLNRLEVYARRFGVRCTDISQPPDMMSGTHVFRVSGHGQPASVARFFAQVEEDRGPLAVESVRLFHQERRTLMFEATILSPKQRLARLGSAEEDDA